jgi:hypothetical protein
MTATRATSGMPVIEAALSYVARSPSVPRSINKMRPHAAYQRRHIGRRPWCAGIPQGLGQGPVDRRDFEEVLDCSGVGGECVRWDASS